jgi:fatty-acyl-CoA synthase
MTEIQLISTLPASILPRIKQAALGNNSVTFVGSAAGSSEKETVSWSSLHDEATTIAAALQQRGIVPGDHVALLGLTSRPMIAALQGIWLAGGCVIVLPIPMRMGSIAEFIIQTRTNILYSDAKMLLLDPGLSSFYEAEKDDPPVINIDQLLPSATGLKAESYKPVADDPERLAILQFTSGSTSVPKGVMLPHRAICANIDAMDQVVNLDTDQDVLVSWLPLYHDMGLIGILTTSMLKGCNLILAAPQDFLSNPADWMHWMHIFKGTITAGPNFSYVLATRALRRMFDTGKTLDLSPVRLALNGAEPIDPEAVEKFVSAARKHGFRPGAEFCAFGMAEVTIAGTFPPVMRGMLCDTVNRSVLETEKIARPVESDAEAARRLPLLGYPVPGLKMRICNPQTGEELALRQVGELQISGASVTTGYYKRPDLTETLFRNGWLRTGDLGYFVTPPGGDRTELVICGRLKDVIIIAGRNIYPEDIERAAGAVDGVRPGNVIAFGIDGSKGKESVVVVAEVKADNYEEIKKIIRYRVLSVCGIPPKDIVLIKPGSLPKTSSGKLQRSLCRQQFLERTLQGAEGQ